MGIRGFFRDVLASIKNGLDGEQDFCACGKIIFSLLPHVQPTDKMAKELFEAIQEVDKKFPWKSYDPRRTELPPSIRNLSNGSFKQHQLGMCWLCFFELTPGHQIFSGNGLAEYKKYFDKLIQELAKKRPTGVFAIDYVIESSTTGRTDLKKQ